MKCECGCGGEVEKGNRFIHGHNAIGKNNNMYGKKSWNAGLTKEIDKRIKKYGKNGGETRKRLFQEGKIKIWNKNLTKETDERLREISEKSKGDNSYWKNKSLSKNHKESIGKGIINFYNQHPEARKKRSKIMKEIRKPTGRYILCKNCDKRFYMTPKRSLKTKFCSQKCYGIYRSKNIDLYPDMFKKGHIVSQQTRLKQGDMRRGKYCGEKSYQWNGGSSFEPYDKSFNNKFKRAIRKRDNQVCMVCGIHKEKLNRALDVHHIDYDKLMSIPQNCISLCRNCHIQTNFDREIWTKIFQEKLAKFYGYQYEDGKIILNIGDRI